MNNQVPLSKIVAFVFEEFDVVVENRGNVDRDYWFIWRDPNPRKEDYEPVRITCDGDNIISALFRDFHWKNKTCPNPYNDEDNKAEVAFIPWSHTPRIRKQNDRYFEIWTKNFMERKEDFNFSDEVIPNYYIVAGDKGYHPPQVYYEGWPELR